jgi:anti-sigma regulatory factor (Ser/Thr protein kinase)
LDSFAKEFPINGQLKEDVLWRTYIRPLLDGIASNVIQICQYGFTEMVNNALEHSAGKQMQISLKRSALRVELIIADDGVGVFKKLANYFNLDDERHAILELSKGKMTTDKAHHTGEGLFFTSRMFDQFTLCSDKLAFIHTEILDDWLVEDQKELVTGTLVMLKISTSSERTLNQVFDQYADAGDDYGFSRTHVPVFLTQYGDENLISRSQAKRLLARFDRFKEIMLDFSGVDMVGQAFADEIFHIYAGEHPEVHISYQDATKQVENMISRALAYKNGR